MFTKNIKTISILALVAVIVLVAAVLIAIGNDSNVSAGADDKINSSIEDVKKDYENQIAELNKIIDDLKSGLISTEEALAKLEENGIKLDDWRLATAALAEKLEKLDETFEKFIESFEKTNEEGAVIVDADDYFDADTIAKFEKAYYNAYIAIIRATSVESMDKAISDLDATLKAEKTVIDVLDDMLKELEADAITGDDLQGIVDAKEYFEGINDVLFGEGEKDAFQARIDALIAAAKKVAVDGFIANVNALPTVAELTGSDEHIAAINATIEALEMIYDLEASVEGNEEFAAAGEKLTAILDRMEVISSIKGNADAINELIKAEANTTFGATVEAANTIKALKTAVANWEETYSIITDSTAEDYNEWIHSLVDYESLAGYVTAFETATADLRANAEKFIAAVDNFGKIDTTSKTALDAIVDTYTECFKTTGPQTIDAILGVTAEKNSVVAAWNKYLALRASYDHLVASIETVENFIKEIYTLVPGSTDKYELHADLKTEDEYWEIDLVIAEVLGAYELDETVFDATLIAQYKIARLYYIIEEAYANVDAAYEGSDNELRDQAKDALILMINSAAKLDYKLVAREITFDLDSEGAAAGARVAGSVHYEIDDSKDASIIEALQIFTYDYCAEFFESYHA